MLFRSVLRIPIIDRALELVLLLGLSAQSFPVNISQASLPWLSDLGRMSFGGVIRVAVLDQH